MSGYSVSISQPNNLLVALSPTTPFGVANRLTEAVKQGGHLLLYRCAFVSDVDYPSRRRGPFQSDTPSRNLKCFNVFEIFQTHNYYSPSKRTVKRKVKNIFGLIYGGMEVEQSMWVSCTRGLQAGHRNS